MAAKKRDRGAAAQPAAAPKRTISDFLNGPNAKWLFFAIYFAVTVFLFRDFLFDGSQMLFGSDTIPDGVYTRQYYKEYHEDFGGVPRWNPYILGGLPFIDAMHGDTFYPGAWLKFYMPLIRALGHKLLWHLLLAGIFMYIFLRTLKIRRDAAFLGGLMYMLAPSFVSLVYPGHDAKMYVIAFLPLAFTFLERGMNRQKFGDFAMLGAVMGLLILTSHMQMAYYSYWALGLYFLFRLMTPPEGMASFSFVRPGMFVMAVVVALALGAIQMLPSYRFTTSQSVRSGEARTSYEYATSWSMHPEEVVGMAVPSFQGNTFLDNRPGSIYHNLYWGRNPFKLNSEYQGIAVLLFALLALVWYRTKHTWFFLGLGLLSLVYAVGATTPLYHLFYSFVPGVKNFRAPGMIIFLFQFSAVVMASMCIAALLDGRVKPRKGPLMYGIFALIGVALVCSIPGGKIFDVWLSLFYHGITENGINNMEANIPIFLRDLWRVVLFAGICLASVRLMSISKLGAAGLIGILAVVVIADETLVSSRFITTLDPARSSSLAPDATVREIRQHMDEEPPFRIMTTLSEPYSHPGNYYAMFGIQSVNGTHNNELKNYEFFRGPNSRNFLQHWLTSDSFEPDLIQANNYLKVANAKYILAPGSEGGTILIPNPGALERVFTVHNFTLVEDDSSAIDIMNDIMFDAERTVILHEPPETEMPRRIMSTASRVVSLEYEGNNPVIHAEFDEPGFLVLSMNWVPYWRAYMDGEQVPVHRAYITFMAVECPVGSHEIRFEYYSEPYEAGKRLTLASLAFIVIALGSAIGVDVMKRRRAA